MFTTLLLTLATAVASAHAQNATSTYSQAGVPTGVPPSGDYTGPLRPQVHFSPPTGFMNDPNGMFIDSEGIWHLYYQYNPNEIVAGNQHWGHTTSRDLYHWVNQPIAIFPGNESQGIFSGSVVVDYNNTSGFFPDQDNGVVAIYSLNSPNDQSQDLAISYDNGYTFEKYEGNPVLTVGSTQFRDPKVIWHEPTQKWVMAIAYAQEFAVGYFTSDNLIDWTAVSNFSYHGLLGLQWECPNMVEIPMEGTDELIWVLLLSINPGAPLGGSITQFYPGSFNGTHFEAVDSAARIADFGKDNYAGQFFYGIPSDEPQVSIAWASNWQYAQTVPTGPQEGFRSAMSIPRRNYLKNTTRIGYVFVSEPYDLSPVLIEEPLASDDDLGNGTLLVPFTDLQSKAVYFELNITDIPAPDNTSSTSATANFTFLSSVSGESLSGGYYLYGDTPFFLNRGRLEGFENPFFTDKFSTNVLYNSDTASFSMSAVLDRAIFEVFLQGGEQSATISVFPEEPLDFLELRTAYLPEGVTVSTTVWGLSGVWDENTDASGNVVGNITIGGDDQAIDEGKYDDTEAADDEETADDDTEAAQDDGAGADNGEDLPAENNTPGAPDDS